MSVWLHSRDLVIEYRTTRGPVRALDGAELAVMAPEVLGVVGESGSGKSTLAATIGRLLPRNAHRIGGDLTIGGRSVFDLGEPELRALRRHQLGFVFQDPIGTLNPTLRIARQVARVLEVPARDPSIEAVLTQVGLTEAARVGRSYPHELSGGMAQRVSIAMAIARRPKLVVADEPTAALDASVRNQILELLVSRCRETEASVVLFSHDLRAVSEYCDRVAVMYGGRVVETGLSSVVFSRPAHPYTEALLKAAPGAEQFGGRIEPIPGTPPVLTTRCEECAFTRRCHWAIDRCSSERPEPRRVADRDVVCHRAEEVLGLSASKSAPGTARSAM